MQTAYRDQRDVNDMRTKLDPHNITIKNSKIRAFGAILLSAISLIALSGSILSNALWCNEKNVPLYFYPGLFIVLIITLTWIPSILISIRSQDFLLKNEDGGISAFGQNGNFSGYRFLKYSEVREIYMMKTFFRKEVIIELDDKSIIKVPMIFSNGLNG